MWSHARYDLRIASDEFYRMTPKQYHLLNDRHLEELIHRETVAALTTAAIINSSFNAPVDPISPAEFIFNLRSRKTVSTPPISEQQKIQRQTAMESFQASSAQIGIELKQFHLTGKAGVLMQRLGIVPKADTPNG